MVAPVVPVPLSTVAPLPVVVEATVPFNTVPPRWTDVVNWSVAAARAPPSPTVRRRRAVFGVLVKVQSTSLLDPAGGLKVTLAAAVVAVPDVSTTGVPVVWSVAVQT